MTGSGGAATHVVPRADFEVLAAGYGDGAVVRRLRNGQLSRNIHQLAALDRSAESAGTAFRAGFALLADVQNAAPGVVAELLIHPHVSAWLAHCVRTLWPADRDPAAAGPRVVEPVTAGGEPMATGLGHLAGIAAAAAVAAGVEFAVTVPARDGAVLLPGLGCARVPNRQTVLVAGGADGLTIDGGTVALDRADDRWEPVHRLVAEADGLRLAVTLDDLDWYRAVHGLPAADRLDQAAVDRWRQSLVLAWDLLVRDHRPYAEPMAVGLRTLVPLRRDLVNRGLSATSTESFGVVFLSEPTDHLALAVALVHEFQHGKLAALMDLVPILVGGDGPRYYAPWRDDPRPLPGLLQGAYAFLAVTDFWRVRRGAGTGERVTPGGTADGSSGRAADSSGHAHFEFARWRERLLQVLKVLADSGRLTNAGYQFLAGMRATVEGWLAGATPRLEDQLARAAADDHRLMWRMRNLRCRPDSVELLVLAWRAGETAPPLVELTTETLHDAPEFHQHARLHLTTLRIREPAKFERLVGAPASLHAELAEATDADLAYSNDQHAAAIAGYRALVALDAGHLAHWAGLILAIDDLGTDTAVAEVLRRAPEWVVAVHRAVLATGAPAPDPATLARWLAPLIADELPDGANPPLADRVDAVTG